MKAIIAMTRSGVIGDKGKLPWHLPQDFQWFKKLTMGRTLIMGRKTWESIISLRVALTRDASLLPGRRVYVVSHHPQLTESPFVTFGSPEAAPPDGIVAGGAEIYRLFWPQVMELFRTLVKDKTITGDTQFYNEEAIDNMFSHVETYLDDAQCTIERMERM
jgi:dihydrofolate reductase